MRSEDVNGVDEFSALLRLQGEKYAFGAPVRGREAPTRREDARSTASTVPVCRSTAARPFPSGRRSASATSESGLPPAGERDGGETGKGKWGVAFARGAESGKKLGRRCLQEKRKTHPGLR